MIWYLLYRQSVYCTVTNQYMKARNLVSCLSKKTSKATTRFSTPLVGWLLFIFVELDPPILPPSTSHHVWTRQRTSLPRYATPWVEMGKMWERQRWQTYAMHLLHASSTSYLRSLHSTIIDLYNDHALKLNATAPSSHLINLRSSRFRNNPNVQPTTTISPPDLLPQLLSLINTAESNISKLFASYLEMLTLQEQNMNLGVFPENAQHV